MTKDFCSSSRRVEAHILEVYVLRCNAEDGQVSEYARLRKDKSDGVIYLCRGPKPYLPSETGIDMLRYFQLQYIFQQKFH